MCTKPRGQNKLPTLRLLKGEMMGNDDLREGTERVGTSTHATLVSKLEFIFYNILLLVIFIIIAIIPPSNFSSIKQDLYDLNDIKIEKKLLRIPELVFTSNNEKFTVSCRNMKNDLGRNFCDEKFPLNSSKIKLLILIDKNHKQGSNISLIKSVTWHDLNQVKTFNIGDEYIKREIQYWKDERLILAIIYFIFMFVLNLFLLRKKS